MKENPLPDNNRLHFEGGGEETTLITDWFDLDPSSSKPLFEVLPEFIVFRPDDESSDSLQETLNLLTIETAKNNHGSLLVIRSLADIFFIHALRSYIRTTDKKRWPSCGMGRSASGKSSSGYP